MMPSQVSGQWYNEAVYEVCPLTTLLEEAFSKIAKLSKEEQDAIAVRSMMNVCISFDHRIMDGAQAGAFVASVKQRLEAIGPDTPIY